MTHRHRTDCIAETRPFRGPVSDRENRAAHGNVMEREVCRCGASRLVNVNGQHVERGPWRGESR